MISVDTNIIFSATTSTDTNYVQAREALIRLSAQGFVLSPVVYAELRASPDWGRLERFLNNTGIAVLWEMAPLVWERAGEASGIYAAQRRKGTLGRRILADFLIAAHAEYHALDVLTFDETVYKAVFPKLRLQN